ncbi:hypothetical protein ACFQX8_23255 [Klenkia terrae]|uniref:hypothetical protein n=1 Tax=Klenkia terrae TaxID=1052259 RepID=UPI00361250B9
MTPDLVVRGGTVVTDGWSGAADVVVAGGRVQALVEPGSVRGPDELDATGRVVVPGGVDPHCHVGFTSGDFTSLDDHRECTTAAVAGGTTTIVDFAIPRPGEAPPTPPSGSGPRPTRGSATRRCTPASWSGTAPPPNSCASCATRVCAPSRCSPPTAASPWPTRTRSCG